MRSTPFACAVLIATFAAGVARADDAAPPQPVAPASTATPPAPAPAPAAPAPTAAAWCTVGDSFGVDPAEAQTATRILCGELWRKLGGHPLASYRATFGKLGSKVVVGVESTDVNGARDERHLELSSIEETSVAAPRLATALVDRKPVSETEGASNVVGAGARAEVQKQGRLKPELGVLGVVPVTTLVAPAPGLYGQLSYFYDRFVLGGGLRIAANGKYSYAAAHVGGDIHFTGDDFSPFAGGGFAWTYQNVDVPAGEGSANGFGAFVQLGVTALRSHRTNFRIAIRGDIPFYTLARESYYSSSVPTTTKTTYSLPLSFTAGMTF